MKRPLLYYFSTESLSFRPLRWAKSKYIGMGVVTGIIALWVTIEINQVAGDVLGLGFAQTSVLMNENQLLHNQLRFLSGKLDVLDKRLAALSQHGNELRAVVDLPKIDPDILITVKGGCVVLIAITVQVVHFRSFLECDFYSGKSRKDGNTKG